MDIITDVGQFNYMQVMLILQKVTISEHSASFGKSAKKTLPISASAISLLSSACLTFALSVNTPPLTPGPGSVYNIWCIVNVYEQCAWPS